MVSDTKLDAPRLYNCWFTKASLPQFHAIMQKLGIIILIDQQQADASDGSLHVGDVQAVWPNVWDEIGAFLDPLSGTFDAKGNRINQTLVQKGGLDAHFVNIYTATDLLPYLKQLAVADSVLAAVVAKTDDFFFVATREEADASEGKIEEGDFVGDPVTKRVIL